MFMITSTSTSPFCRPEVWDSGDTCSLIGQLLLLHIAIFGLRVIRAESGSERFLVEEYLGDGRLRIQNWELGWFVG
jgi:hypothetical protein